MPNAYFVSEYEMEQFSHRIWRLAAYLGIKTSYTPPDERYTAVTKGKRERREDLDPSAIISFSPCATNEHGEIEACQHLRECARGKCCQAFHQFCSHPTYPNEKSAYLRADRTPCRKRFRALFSD